MQKSHSRFKREQSGGEEIANAISHGFGLVAALIGTPFLITQAVRQADTAFVVGVSIFCATMIILYLGSSLYHALPAGKAKQLFRRIHLSPLVCCMAHGAGHYLALSGGWQVLVLFLK